MTSELFLLDDSPMRNPPAALEPKQKIALDGLRYIFDMIAIAYARMLEDLYNLSVNFPQKSEKKVVASAFLNGWSIVDNLYRLFQLLQDVPGLKKTPPLEVYLRKLKDSEELRHGVQHIDNQLTNCASASIPLWGSLKWIYTPGEPDKGCIAMNLISGAVRSGLRNVINPLGKVYFIPIGLVTLEAFGHSLDLSDLMLRTKEFCTKLDTSLKKNFGIAPSGGADILIGLEMKFGEPTSKAEDH